MNKKERQIAYSAILGFIDACLNTCSTLKELLEKPKEEKVLDWNLVADGPAVRCEEWNDLQPSEIFSRQFHSVNHPDLRFDTERWNAFRGGECPFGQPEAVWVEAEDSHGAIRSARADFLEWPGEVMIYRVVSLVDPWRYPE